MPVTTSFEIMTPPRIDFGPPVGGSNVTLSAAPFVVSLGVDTSGS